MSQLNFSRMTLAMAGIRSISPVEREPTAPPTHTQRETRAPDERVLLHTEPTILWMNHPDDPVPRGLVRLQGPQAGVSRRHVGVGPLGTWRTGAREAAGGRRHVPATLRRRERRADRALRALHAGPAVGAGAATLGAGARKPVVHDVPARNLFDGASEKISTRMADLQLLDREAAAGLFGLGGERKQQAPQDGGDAAGAGGTERPGGDDSGDTADTEAQDEAGPQRNSRMVCVPTKLTASIANMVRGGAGVPARGWRLGRCAASSKRTGAAICRLRLLPLRVHHQGGRVVHVGRRWGRCNAPARSAPPQCTSSHRVRRQANSATATCKTSSSLASFRGIVSRHSANSRRGLMASPQPRGPYRVVRVLRTLAHVGRRRPTRVLLGQGALRPARYAPPPQRPSTRSSRDRRVRAMSRVRRQELGPNEPAPRARAAEHRHSASGVRRGALAGALWCVSAAPPLLARPFVTFSRSALGDVYAWGRGKYGRLGLSGEQAQMVCARALLVRGRSPRHRR
jgi:hypothetical protein